MKIYFWQNVISHLESPFIRALTNFDDLELFWIAQHDLPKWRTDMGWSLPSLNAIKYLVNPSSEALKGIFNFPQNESVHIFSPNWTLPTINKAFRMAVNCETTVGLLSEAADLFGVKGRLRLIAGIKRRIQYGKRVDFVLAIGNNGRKYYESCGWENSKIYDFGYITEPVEGPDHLIDKGVLANSTSDAQKKFRIVFVGQLVFRKGADLALLALSEFSEDSYHLDVVGDGPEKERLTLLTNDLGISDVVSFHGSLSNYDANTIISESDLLILPSRRDGWGAVVNESLMLGVPVICSDTCGASDLVRGSYRGQVFKSGSVESLIEALDTELKHGKLSIERRHRIKHWAENSISGSVVASYLLDVINFVKNGGSRPEAPWKRPTLNELA